jgi:hypothetical protein
LAQQNHKEKIYLLAMSLFNMGTAMEAFVRQIAPEAKPILEAFEQSLSCLVQIIEAKDRPTLFGGDLDAAAAAAEIPYADQVPLK